MCTREYLLFSSQVWSRNIGEENMYSPFLLQLEFSWLQINLQQIGPINNRGIDVYF